MKQVDWSLFKCRCSAITKMMANKQGFAPLTELQENKVLELEAKEKDKGLTGTQQTELNAMYAKREMSKKIVLSDSCIEYLMIVYAWETEGMIPVDKESMEILSISKGKKQEAQAGALLGFVDDVVYQTYKERI